MDHNQQHHLVVQRIILDTRLRLPQYAVGYATPYAAGMDVFACVPDRIRLWPGDTARVPLGFAVHLADSGYAGLLLSRSGLGTRGVVIAHGAGLIDADYQGELIAPLWYRADDDGGPPIDIDPMARVAQLVIVPIVRVAEWEDVDMFGVETFRAGGGFGSTG